MNDNERVRRGNGDSYAGADGRTVTGAVKVTGGRKLPAVWFAVTVWRDRPGSGF
jgi:hypothetical protein